MNVTGLVLEKETQKPIPFANVFISDANGNPIRTATISDTDGKFILGVNSGEYITAAIVGRTSVTQKTGDASGNTTQYWYLPMDAAANLGTATVTANQDPAPGKPKNWPMIIGASLLWIAIIAVIIKKVVTKK